MKNYKHPHPNTTVTSLGRGGFLEDVLDVIGEGARLVGAESDLETELIVGFDQWTG